MESSTTNTYLASGPDHKVKTKTINVAYTQVVNNNYITQIDKRQQATMGDGPIWSGPYEIRDPVKSFTGRDDELKHLHVALRSESGQVVVSQIYAISGLGGIGKSELARKYVFDYKQHYGNNVIWINAETQGSFRNSFQGLAKELKIAITEKREEKEQEKDIKSIVKDVYKYFENTDCLFIFDNVEEYKDIKQFLPSCYSLSRNKKKPNILITSRNRKWETSIKVLSLNTFTEKEAIQFIKLSLSIENNLQDIDIKKLAEKLQYFPLALQQAVAYIKIEDEILKNVNPEKQFNIIKYLQEYKINEEQLLDYPFSADNYDCYIRTTLTTWQTTINKLKENKTNGRKALEILYIIAYFAPDNIPTKIFLQLTNGVERKLGHALQLAKQYCMITLRQGVLNIHRLVQQVTRLKLQNERKEERILAKALELINTADLQEKHSHIIFIWNYASVYCKLIDRYYFNSINGLRTNTPLHILTENGCYETIKAVLTHIEKNHPNKLYNIVNALGDDDKTPLHFAAERGNLDIVKYLIEKKGADFSVPDRYGKTPLHHAAEGGYLDVAKYLIEENGANINTRDIIGKIPLHCAAYSGNLDILKYLIEEKGANINTRDITGKTTLHCATYGNNLDVLKYLIEEKGADFNAPDKSGRTPLYCSAEGGNLDLVKYLIEVKGADFSAPDNDGETPLHCAAKWGKWDTVRYLIEEKGADFNIPDKDGETPLYYAAEWGKLEIVKYFIEEKGADFNTPDKDGKTPLHCAAYCGKWDIVRYLIELKGADFNAPDIFGKTPLHIAAYSGNLDVLKYLVEEKGVNINTSDKSGRTPLHSAAHRGNLDVLKYLIEEKGVNINTPDKYGGTPLHYAVEEGNLDLVKYLIEEKGADFNVSDKSGKTPLHCSAEGGNLDVVKYLIEEKGAGFNASDKSGRTSLHSAAYSGNLDVLRYLVEEKGANINTPDVFGKTPLYNAAQNCNWDVVKYLKERKDSDFNAPDKNGKNPWTYRLRNWLISHVFGTIPR